MTMNAPAQKLAPVADASFRLLLESAADCILIVDRWGQLLWANAKVCDLFGYCHGELLGQPVETLVPERHRAIHQTLRASFSAAPSHRAMGAGLQLAARHKDGSEFPVEISLSYAKTDGELQIMAIVTDITRLQQSEQERESLLKAKIEQKEQEIRTLERLSHGNQMGVTARLFDLAPIQQCAPTVFDDLVRDYAEAIDLALEMRIYKTEHPLSDRLRSMAEKIGFLKGTPRDVIDIHQQALKLKSQESKPLKVRGYIEEGHLLLVELMGYLAARYRHYATAPRQPQSDPGKP